MQLFNLNIPISKIDEEQRIVYGYATKEELDRQGDIVDYDASKKAFSAWGGNIREQHDAKRVIGKRVSMEFDDENKQILVGAYISKSPDGESAWTKVKEGLFSGFSIGGKIKSIIKEDLNKDGVTVSANRIMDYDLSELSLVDVPACPSAQLVMVKSVDGQLHEVEELHQSADGAPLPWFMKAFAYAPDQLNHLAKSADNKNMSSESKEIAMSTETKEVEKAVAVHGGVARDDQANEVTPEVGGAVAEEAAAPAVEPAKTTEPAKEGEEGKTEAPVADPEKADKAEMKKGLYTVAELADCVSNLQWIVSDAEWDAQFTGEKGTAAAELKAAVTAVANALVSLTQEAVADLSEPTVELADQPADLLKAVDLKLVATEQNLLKSLTEAVTGAVASQIKPLEDRLTAIESQPVGAAPRKVYAEVDKVADAATTADDVLLQKAADMEANPQNYGPLERTQLATELFKRRKRTN